MTMIVVIAFPFVIILFAIVVIIRLVMRIETITIEFVIGIEDIAIELPTILNSFYLLNFIG